MIDVLIEQIDYYLKRFGDVLFDICVWFSDMYDFCLDKFALDILAPFFLWLNSLFYDAYSWVGGTRLSIVSAFYWIDYYVSPEGWVDTFERYFPFLYYFYMDPAGELRYLIGLVFDLTPYEAQSAEFIIKTLFERYFPELYLLWRDPGAWFAATLKERTPLLYYLIVDPAGQMRYLIAQLFDLTPYEARTPEMIVKVLFERYFPELYLIWRDPDRWLDQRLQPLLDKLRDELREFIAAAWERLVDTYEDAFETISARLYYLVEHTLRFFWEGEW